MNQTSRAHKVVSLEETSERARLLEIARSVIASEVDSWSDHRMVVEKDLLVAEGNRLDMRSHPEVSAALKKLLDTLNRDW